MEPRLKIVIILTFFLNQLMQFLLNNATNLHHFTEYAVLPHNREIVMRP